MDRIVWCQMYVVDDSGECHKNGYYVQWNLFTTYTQS